MTIILFMRDGSQVHLPPETSLEFWEDGSISYMIAGTGLIVSVDRKEFVRFRVETH